MILLRLAAAIAVEELFEAVALGAAEAVGQRLGRHLWKEMKRRWASPSRRRLGRAAARPKAQPKTKRRTAR